MKFKVLLAIFVILTTTAANAVDGRYTLTYQKENKWVAKEDLKPLREAVVFFANNDLKIKATCSEQDIFCKERVDLINHVFNKQKVKQKVSIIETSKNIPANNIVVESVNLDNNKYSNLLINYTDKNTTPVDKSQNDITQFLKYAELKYLSQFKMYCQNVDDVCKNRFKELNTLISKTLTFKYNFALYENANLENNQTQLIAHRHNYAINNPLQKPVTTSKIIEEESKKEATNYIAYSKDKNIIVFKEHSADLELLERLKIERLIANSSNNAFMFACGEVTDQLCQDRVHAIKNYALKNTSNIIIMEQFRYNVYKDHVLVIDKK